MASSVSTVVFPAAGLGTRILPATKAFPKELLPLVDRPVIQYGVEEAIAAGFSRVVLVTSPDNAMTSAHFAPNPGLEMILAERGKTEALEKIRAVSGGADITTVHQTEPRGLGHAVLAARDHCEDSPFAVALPDDVIDADPPALKQMVDVFMEINSPVILVQRVPSTTVERYGIIDAKPVRDGVYQVTDMVEKPRPNEAPSNLAIVGRYILTPDLFPLLEKTAADHNGEVQLTDGLRRLLQKRSIYACEIHDAVRHDVGNPLGFIQASVYFALQQPSIASELRDYLKTV